MLFSFLKPKNINLTEGNPGRQIIRFMIPLLVSGLLQQLYNAVDAAIVGHFCGIDAYSAVGGTAPVLFVHYGTILGITAGAGVITAQRFGAKDENAMRKSIACSYLVCIGFSILLTVGLIPLTELILTGMNFSGVIFGHAKDYLLCIFGGTIMSALYNTAFAQSRSIGDSVTPLIWLAVSAVLNIILNYLFVAAFGWGVTGVGIATISAMAISAVGCIISLMVKYPVMRLTFEDWLKSTGELWAQISVGVPMALQFIMTGIGVVIRQSATNTLGAVAMAAYSTGCRIESFVALPIFLMGTAITTYAAQNYGAGKYDRLKSGIRMSMRGSAVYSVFACAAILTFYAPFTRIFLPSPGEELLRYVFVYLRATGFFYIPLAAILVYRNSLQGMNYQTGPLIGGFLELLCRGLLAYPLLRNFGYDGIVFTEAITWSAAGLLNYCYYRYVIRGFNKISHAS